MRLSLLSALALAFAAGILAADRGVWGTGPALQVGLALLAIGWAWHRARFALAVAIAFAAGAASIAAPIEASRRVRPHTTFDAVVEGRICGASSGPGWVVRDLCDAYNRRVRGFDRRAVPAGIRVLAFHEPEAFAALRAWPVGSWVRARLRIRPLVPLRNPGGRPRFASLVRRGIGARANLVSPPLAVRLDSGGSNSARVSLLGDLRGRLSDRLNEQGPGGALIAALTLGDRRGLGTGALEAFRALGVSHLLAISGLHLVGVTGLAYFLSLGGVRRLPALTARFDTRRIAAGMALGGATLYAGLGGWGVSLQRAWVCVAVLLGMSILGRRAASREVLSGAALVVLSLEPAALFDLGAQLSFAATAALLFDPGVGKAPSWDGDEARGRSRWFLAHSLRASATALAATVPILAFHGVAVTPVALLANLVLVPAFGFVVLPGCLLGLGLVSVDAAAPALQGLCAVFRELVQLLAFLGRWAAGLSVESPPGGLAWCACAGIAVVTLCARSTPMRLVGSLACVGVLTLPLQGALTLEPPYLAVLDVGRGDAIVLRGRDATILVDAGAAFRFGADRGASVVVPALRALGVERLDVVIGSHADLDHRGGLPTVVREFEVGEIWVPAGEPAEGFAELRRAARERQVPVVERAAGDAEGFRGDLRLATLWPPRSRVLGSRNERSLVTRIEVGEVAVLLPGDVGFSAESALLEQAWPIQADILLLPHHGSAKSLSSAFLERVSPAVAVVSAPCEETSRLPAKATLQRVHRRGVAVWWTGRDGAVVVSLKGPVAAWGWRDDALGLRCRWAGAS